MIRYGLGKPREDEGGWRRAVAPQVSRSRRRASDQCSTLNSCMPVILLKTQVVFTEEYYDLLPSTAAAACLTLNSCMPVILLLMHVPRAVAPRSGAAGAPPAEARDRARRQTPTTPASRANSAAPNERPTTPASRANSAAPNERFREGQSAETGQKRGGGNAPSAEKRDDVWVP